MCVTINFQQSCEIEHRTTAVFKLIKACRMLDARAVFDLLEDDSVFEKTERNEFLTQILDVFNDCAGDDISQLIQYHAKCNYILCFFMKGQQTVGFKDRDNKKRLGLIFLPLISCASEITICEYHIDPSNVRKPNRDPAHSNASATV